jgi:WD40 repeat protein
LELVNLRAAASAGGTRASTSSSSSTNAVSSSSVPTSAMITASIQQHLPANDVAWGLKSRGLATAAASGSVVLWSLSPGGSSGRLDRILTEHSRAVNRVSFHPSEGSLLLSASQDGSMKLWDLRSKSGLAKMTFQGRSEAVRDAQFSPCSVEFAAAFENGVSFI